MPDNVCKNCEYLIGPVLDDDYYCMQVHDLEYNDISVTGCPKFKQADDNGE